MERDPYSRPELRKVAQLIGNFAVKHMIFHFIDERGYPLTMIFHEDSLKAAGIDTCDEDDVDIDEDKLEELVETAINPDLN